VQFLIDECLRYPKWLFGAPLSKQIFLLRNTPNGIVEQSPSLLLKNEQNYVLWDLLANDRLMRMFENEWEHGSAAFTPVDMMQMLHQAIFAKTIAGQRLDIMERSLQKSFLDALITAGAETEGVKINKSLADTDSDTFACPELGDCLSTSRPRTYETTTTQVSRCGDAISLKRSELLRIMRLCKAKVHTGDAATQMHYEDIVLRVQTALGLSK
jgi:hypothetical protein